MKSFTSEPVPKVDPGTIVIKESKTGGLGVFALRNIKRGDLLLAERPLVVCPMAFAVDLSSRYRTKISTMILNGSEAELSDWFQRIQAYKRILYPFFFSKNADLPTIPFFFSSESLTGKKSIKVPSSTKFSTTSQ